jgi:hypothetical protein
MGGSRWVGGKSFKFFLKKSSGRRGENKVVQKN